MEPAQPDSNSWQLKFLKNFVLSILAPYLIEYAFASIENKSFAGKAQNRFKCNNHLRHN